MELLKQTTGNVSILESRRFMEYIHKHVTFTRLISKVLPEVNIFATGDEVVVIQAKLDGIKTRYAEINSMSNNVTKTLEQALSLASKLEHTHEDLASWLDKVESKLEVFGTQEPVGEQLTQVQESRKVSLLCLMG